MSVSYESLNALKQSMESIGRDGARRFGSQETNRVDLGFNEVDQSLGGGLLRGATHDILPKSAQEGGAATGFALALVARLAFGVPWVWVRQDMAAREIGEPYGPGLAAFGLDPASLVLVAVPDAKEALRAAEESLRCQALGAVLFEPWGDPKQLDLTATRRLALAAEESGVTLITLRSGGHFPLGSCRTRWEIGAANSQSEGGEELGFPAFSARLVLNRQAGAGGPGGAWIMEWNHGKCLFQKANFGTGLSQTSHRPVAEAASPLPFRHAS